MKTYFTDKETETIRSIFIRLEPESTYSIQSYSALEGNRTGYTFGICNYKREYSLLYQNFRNLSPWRYKLLLKLAKKISYPVSITYPEDGITRVGWKT